jgi:hypothetical protein
LHGIAAQSKVRKARLKLRGSGRSPDAMRMPQTILLRQTG